MKLKPGLLLPLLAMLLTGCIDVQTTVRVNTDGGGLVEERVLMSEALTQMMKSMGDSPDGGVADEQKMREQAKAMGEGVRLRSVEALTDGKREGYVALFSFTDINRVRLDQNPGDKAPKPPGAESDPASTSKEFITFAFTPGDTAELVVKLPQGPAPGSKPDSPPGATAAKDPSAAGVEGKEAELAKEIMKQMFDGLRIAITLEITGTIVETNASHVAGNKITLLELDFGALLANVERFAEFSAANPQSVTEAKKLMGDLPGIEAELEPEITIRFSGTPPPAQARGSARGAVDGPVAGEKIGDRS